MDVKIKAPRNRTITLEENDTALFSNKLIKLSKQATVEEITNKTILQDVISALEFLPESFVDLLFIDPPYNLNKNFNSNTFREMKNEDYETWMD